MRVEAILSSGYTRNDGKLLNYKRNFTYYINKKILLYKKKFLTFKLKKKRRATHTFQTSGGRAAQVMILHINRSYYCIYVAMIRLIKNN